MEMSSLHTLKIRISDKNLSLQEHMEYLRKPEIFKNSKSVVILLNSLFKTLIVNEGIHPDDDIYRIVNEKGRQKVIKILKNQKEIRDALESLKNQRHEF